MSGTGSMLISCRCMFASNYPVDIVDGFDFKRQLAGFKAVVSHLSDAEQQLVFSGTAKRVYRF